MERLAGKVILLWGWRRALAAFLAGSLLALAQPPYDFFAVGFVSFPVLVWLLDGAASSPGEGWARRLRVPFLIGWWFGFGFFLAGLWWTGNALLVEADLFAWALPFAIFGLPALLAVFPAFAAVLARLLWSDGIGRIAALAFAFALAEWLRTFVLTGFPWNAVGQAAMPIPLLMQSVTIVGMEGMNALAVLVFAMPALLASDRDRARGAVLALLLVAAHAGFGAWRLAAGEGTPETLAKVRIVQPSILQTQKWDAAEQDRIFATYLEMSARPAEGAEPDLIVWPETAVPFVLSERPDALTALGELIGPQQTLLAGAVRTEGGPSGRYYNAVVAINGEGETFDAVDKLHLVPFGEYLPFSQVFSRIGLRQVVQSVAAFSPGSERHAIETRPGIRVLPFICYEIIFPHVAGHGGIDADIILNVTNDAWFGDTPGPYQHLRQAQIRAVEAGRPLVRAANNGISAVIDAKGRILDAFAIDAVGVLDVEVPRQHLASPVDPWIVAGAIMLAFCLWACFTGIGSRRRVD